jgi:membrane-associated phospholipid phosphatase
MILIYCNYIPNILKKMHAMYKTCMKLYPQLLLIVIIALCHVRQISYVYAIGYIINTCVNFALKIGFRALIGDAGNRPSVPYLIQTNSIIDQVNSYGFPSGHAQSVGYFVAFVHQFWQWSAWHPVWIIAGLMIASWLLHTRVAFQQHTIVQVLTGFGFGIMVFQLVHSWVRSRI